MSRLRLLILAPGCNPDSISTSLVGYAHSEALARIHDVTLVANARYEAAIRKRSCGFLLLKSSVPPTSIAYSIGSYIESFMETMAVKS